MRNVLVNIPEPAKISVATHFQCKTHLNASSNTYVPRNIIVQVKKFQMSAGLTINI